MLSCVFFFFVMAVVHCNVLQKYLIDSNLVFKMPETAKKGQMNHQNASICS